MSEPVGNEIKIPLASKEESQARKIEQLEKQLEQKDEQLSGLMKAAVALAAEVSQYGDYTFREVLDRHNMKLEATRG